MCHQAMLSCSHYVLCLPCKARGVGAYMYTSSAIFITNRFKLLFEIPIYLCGFIGTYNIITLISIDKSGKLFGKLVLVCQCKSLFKCLQVSRDILSKNS